MELEQVKPFIGSTLKQKIQSNAINMLGFCFDGTTSFRPGARFGPDALREASTNLEEYSPYLNKDLSDVAFYDLGNLPFNPSRFDLTYKQFKEFVQNTDLKQDKVKLLTLGGEHSISIAPIELYLNQYPDLILLHLDAHADLRDGYLDNPYSHASIIRRALDHFKKGHELIQYGIRSGTKEEFQWMREHGTLETSLEELCRTLEAINSSRPIYLTLDLDFFDPSIMPGTGTPEAGGETFHSFIKIIKILSSKNLVGADVTELAPTIDATGNSSCLASKVVRELILTMS